MKLSVALLALTSLVILGSHTASADTIDNYSFSVATSAGTPNPFTGHTYTGTFMVDEQTGDVTDFSTNVLGGSYTASDLGDVATLTNGSVTSLHFQLNIAASDGSNHSSGFTAGFSNGQITSMGLSPDNYFAFLYPSGFVEGGGTPVFTDLGPIAATPEPSTFALLGTGLAGAAGLLRRRLTA